MRFAMTMVLLRRNPSVRCSRPDQWISQPSATLSSQHLTYQTHQFEDINNMTMIWQPQLHLQFQLAPNIPHAPGNKMKQFGRCMYIRGLIYTSSPVGKNLKPMPANMRQPAPASYVYSRTTKIALAAQCRSIRGVIKPQLASSPPYASPVTFFPFGSS